MILEAIYEPIFISNSHGFRPNRSCHTALAELKKEFNGVRWFIEGDIRGICNYYRLAANFNKLAYLDYLMEYSCLKTLANKHKSKIFAIVKMFKDGKGKWGIPYETKQSLKRCYFAKFSNCKGGKFLSDKITKDAAIYLTSRNSLEDRLKAKICELCDTTKSN